MDKKTEGEVAIEDLKEINEKKLRVKNNNKWFMFGMLSLLLLELAFIGIITLSALLSLLLEAGY